MNETIIYAFQDGGLGTDVTGMALAVINGEPTRVGSHLSSSVKHLKSDLGVTSTRKHDKYSEIFPEGFKVEWVDDVLAHPVLSQFYEKRAETIVDNALNSTTA